jgi:hypothetical protein
MRISSIGLIAAVSLGLGGCAYNGLGMGVGTGYGYDDYGYGYDRYGYGGYDPYGYNRYAYNRYGSPYGWYNGFYYPGSGLWVYDRDGRRREITRNEQAHFGRLGEVFRQRVKQANGSTSSGSVTTTTSGRTPLATTPQVRERASARATERVAERRERRAARVEESRDRADRTTRRRDRKDD